MCAEAKFSKINQLTHSKSQPGRMNTERRVSRLCGGLPMDIRCINFRVAGIVKQSGFV